MFKKYLAVFLLMCLSCSDESKREKIAQTELPVSEPPSQKKWYKICENRLDLGLPFEDSALRIGDSFNICFPEDSSILKLTYSGNVKIINSTSTEPEFIATKEGDIFVRLFAKYGDLSGTSAELTRRSSIISQGKEKIDVDSLHLIACNGTLEIRPSDGSRVKIGDVIQVCLSEAETYSIHFNNHINFLTSPSPHEIHLRVVKEGQFRIQAGMGSEPKETDIDDKTDYHSLVSHTFVAENLP